MKKIFFCSLKELSWKLVLNLLASAKSIGERFVSASAPIKNIMNIGNKGTINQIAFWASIIAVMFKFPVKNIINKIAELSINS